eukprot:3428271-Rhodomonas_salina.3
MLALACVLAGCGMSKRGCSEQRAHNTDPDGRRAQMLMEWEAHAVMQVCARCLLPHARAVCRLPYAVCRML